ncbi:MAG: hypothetical protein WAT29_02995 [Thiolinea sp.]
MSLKTYHLGNADFSLEQLQAYRSKLEVFRNTMQQKAREEHSAMTEMAKIEAIKQDIDGLFALLKRGEQYESKIFSLHRDFNDLTSQTEGGGKVWDY